jgi:hypothetical protein
MSFLFGSLIALGLVAAQSSIDSNQTQTQTESNTNVNGTTTVASQSQTRTFTSCPGCPYPVTSTGESQIAIFVVFSC